MNRREFLKTTAATGVAITIPLELVATETFKYPLIGKPYYSVIMQKEWWENLEIPRFQNGYYETIPAKAFSRVHSTTELANNTVKVIIEKLNSPFSNIRPIGMPMKIAFMAESIVDMETYEYIKNRHTKEGPLQIPLGADYDLVMRNREAKWSI